MMFVLLTFVTISWCTILPSLTALELPRGVSITKASFYQLGQPFKCLDGSGTVAWHQVNDDYCDCADGSDEPGTSACPNGQFYCRDTQYKVVTLRSSLVNDGVCDCCDGSDEYAGRVTCESTCGVLAAAVEQARSLKLKEVERGHSLFKTYVAELKVRKEQERIAAEQAERERQLKAEQQDEAPEAPDTTPSGHGSPENVEHIESDSAKPELSESGEHIDHDVPPEHVDEEGKDYTDQDESAESQEDEDSSPTKSATEQREPVDYGPEEAFRMLEDLSNCLEFTDHQYTYQLCAFKDVYQRDRSDSGKGTLLGKWTGWGAVQEGEPPERKYNLMHFNDGWTCWNGPSRSVKVHVHCSDENRITDVKEPSRCEYEMQLNTPAACFEHPEDILKQFHSEL